MHACVYHGRRMDLFLHSRAVGSRATVRRRPVEQSSQALLFPVLVIARCDVLRQPAIGPDSPESLGRHRTNANNQLYVRPVAD